MTIDTAIMVLAFLSSSVALYFSIRRQSHDEDKCDADTIASLFETVKGLEKENREIKQEFEKYKRETSQQLGELASEIVRYRKWAKRLVSQLDSAGITPARFEDV